MSKTTISEARLKRLINVIYKLSGWSGNDISELIDSGHLEEGDLDE